jgi:hypothetical protein
MQAPMTASEQSSNLPVFLFHLYSSAAQDGKLRRATRVTLDDLFAFAMVQAFNSYLCSTLHVAHAHRMRGHRWADDPAAIVEMQRFTDAIFFLLLRHGRGFGL